MFGLYVPLLRLFNFVFVSTFGNFDVYCLFICNQVISISC